MAVVVPSGFQVTSQDPIDSRITVVDQTARLALNEFNVYPGLIVYQQSTQEVYVLNLTGSVNSNSGWSLLSGSAGSSGFAAEWSLGASGNTDFVFSGDGFPNPTSDPEITLVRGQDYKFSNDNGAGLHPFQIQTDAPSVGSGTSYNTGVTNNGAAGGAILTWNVPFSAPDQLYYQCTSHPDMSGSIKILSYSSGSGSVLTQDLTTNQTVGGISSGNLFAAGSTIEALLRTMLISAIDSSISSLSLKNNASTVWNSSTTREVYNDIGPFNTASFSSAAQSPTGLYPISASLTASGGTTGDFDIYFGDDGFGSSNSFGLGGSQTITKTSPGTVTFTVKSEDPVSFSSKTTSRTATYVYPFYYGSSTTDYSTSGNVDGVLSKSIVSKSTRTVNYDFSSKFAYFCYPASYGDLSSVKDGNGFEVKEAFDKYTRNQAGSTGWSGISYNIYKTATTSVPNQNYVFTF
jgi:hypothetical protein